MDENKNNDNKQRLTYLSPVIERERREREGGKIGDAEKEVEEDDESKKSEKEHRDEDQVQNITKNTAKSTEYKWLEDHQAT